MAKERRFIAGDVPLMTTTLWDFPSQNYGDGKQGDTNYVGATPSYVIANLLHRYTDPADIVLDPMAGSGTTPDVARDLGRTPLAFDLQSSRKDIEPADARSLPLKDRSVDFVFVDPPYSTHVKYSGKPECIGELDARDGGYFEAMEVVIEELHRVLRPDRYLALYVSDSFQRKKPFVPIGFELFAQLRQRFTPIDIVGVVRHNRTLMRNHWHTSALEGNYYLRGFNYLFVMYKEPSPGYKPRKVGAPVPENARPPKKSGAPSRKRRPYRK